MPPKHSRRGFFKTAGMAASLAAAGNLMSQESRAEEPTKDSEDRPIRLGLASYSLRKFSLEETIAMTRRVGLDFICLKSCHLPMNATPEKITATVAAVQEAGLTLYGGGVIGMHSEEQVHQAFDYAKAAGMSTIVGVPAPNLLTLVDEKVRQFDIRVAIHNHGPGDKTYPAPEYAYEKIKDLDPRIGLCMDVGHTARYGANPVFDAERFADRLHDIHIKDVSAAEASGKTVEIGRGVIYIRGLMRILDQTNYSGIVSFEFEKDPTDPLAGLAESVGYVRGVLAAMPRRYPPLLPPNYD